MARSSILISVLLIIFSTCHLCAGSAIPMWEYLSRREKMSHLYSMFAKQVSSYCKTNTNVSVAQCKRDLLVYGVDKLDKMSDSYLDSMDPYQRGASDIIWDSMMKGHPSMSSKKDETTPTPIHEPSGDYEKNPLFDDHNDDVNDKRQKPHGLATVTMINYAADMDQAYGHPTGAEGVIIDPLNYLAAAASSIDLHYDLPSETQASTTNFLSGPMIVRVRPDGSPVEEDRYKPLPRDDDREAMTIGKNQIPTIEQIARDYSSGYVSPMIGRRTYITTYRTYDGRFLK